MWNKYKEEWKNQMDYPDYEFYDTLAASRRAFRYLANHQLHTVAAECGYCLEKHHNALADAEACAWIAREILWSIRRKTGILLKNTLFSRELEVFA